ncbi:MAG: hypothetical protein WBN40_10450 [Pseudomonadales bacterium]
MKYLLSNTRRLGMYAALLFAATTAQAADYNEIPAQIVDVDVQGNAVTLAALGFGEARYRFAFDLQIKLLGGENGTANNLRAGDGVTALVDEGDRLVHAIYVVSSEN